MNEKQKEVLQAVREGCKTTLQVSTATSIERQYCARLLKQLVLDGYVEIYESTTKDRAIGGGNKYRALESRYMKKQKEFHVPPRDPLIVALFGEAHGNE